MKRFLKGIMPKSDSGGDNHRHKDKWTNVHSILKGMSLSAALRLDKEYEEKDSVSKKLNWFHADTNRNLAELRLREAGMEPGMFLVRPSLFKGNYVLSMVASGTLRHYHIKQRGTGCYYIVEEQIFRGVDDLIAYYLDNAVDLPSELKVPCAGGTAPPPESRGKGFTNILHQCIIENAISKVVEILAHDLCPSIDAKNRKGNTALHEACIQGMDKVIQQLLVKGANPTMLQNDGYTPIMLCCIHNKPTTIRMLVELGHADPQESNYPVGNVALHEAAMRGHMECVKMLLSLKAPAWPRNDNGISPHELALEAGHKEIANYIDNFTAFPAVTDRSEWYYGELTKEKAEAIMDKHDCREGLFFVRKSSRRKNLFILVLCSMHRVYNYEIQTQDGVAFYIDQGPLFSSLEHVIEYYSIRADGLTTLLKTAIHPDSGKEIPMNGGGEAEQYWSQLGSNAGCSSTPTHRLPAPLPCANTPTPRPPEPIKLNIKDINIGREIGEGEYGAVYRGTWLSHQKELVSVAIKTLHVRHASARTDFLKEAQVMVQLSHQCIVQLIGVCTHQQNTYLVQELVPLGSMLDYMLDYPERININPDLFLWASQVASGMHYLEVKQFVHRDLAARNILLQSNVQAKVGDFGLSRATSQGDNDYQASVGGRWPIKWYAPECVNYGTFSSRSDVWSYGVTLWEMFTLGEQPFGEKTGAQVITMIEKGQRLKRPKKCNAEVYAQMSACWEYNPVNRPTFRDLEHFFNDTYSFIPGIKLYDTQNNISSSIA